jgi:Tol biopolymer transport system component
MPLATGSRLGSYEILAPLGAGGMGEVYRARDTKLDRDVALKILPDAFAADPDRRARFGREAKTLAALNHPHIAQIHGFEESGATSALVMELVEGEDLSQRIKRGPIRYEEAIAIARQIAMALEAAHDQGIIHRDLKPANIKIRDDGTIKVLDFGLAKALDPVIAHGSSGSIELANSPTITSPAALTIGGVILGTAAYMAPEQAKGRTVDKRADIWAFGCVLYEMLTGRRAFSGDDVSDTLASILKSDVDLTSLPRPAVRLIKKCLEKDPKRRLHDIGDAWDLIDDAAPTAVAPSRARWLPWSLAGLLLVSTVALAIPFLKGDSTPSPVRFQVAAPPKHEFAPYLSISPDGRRLAFTAADETRTVHLWVRDLESLESRRVPGTEDARSVFWSPDSRFVAFIAGASLKRVDPAGGSPQLIGTVASNAGFGDWNASGDILTGSRGGGPIQRVFSGGGTPVAVTAVDTARGEVAHAFPKFLPDGRRFLYFRQSSRPELMGLYVGSLDRQPDQQDMRMLVRTQFGPYFVLAGSHGTRLLFTRGTSLEVQTFDPTNAQLSGEPNTIAAGIGSSGSMALFTASNDTLAFRTGPDSAPNFYQPTLVGRNGTPLRTVGEPGRFGTGPFALAISPAGQHIVAIMTPQLSSETDLFLLELARGIRTRFTSGASSDSGPRWSPDGTRIAFRSSGGSRPSGIYTRALNSPSQDAVLVHADPSGLVNDWSPDGRWLLFAVRRNNVEDLWILPFADPRQAQPLVESSFSELAGRFSPDGRWIAYQSDESGEPEVYVRPFTVGPGGKASTGAAWRASTSGGVQPRWRADGKELFYRDASGAIASVDVTVGASSISTSVPRRLFSPAAGVPSWDVSRDGKQFLVLVPVTQSMPDPITVVVNWQQGAKP